MAWTEDQERAVRARQQMWRISTMGMELFASIVGMFLLGWLIDVWVGTSHTFKLVGLGVGFVGGFWNFFKAVRKLRASPIKGMAIKSPQPADSASPAASKASQAHIITPGAPAADPSPSRKPRDPALFARDYFTDEQLEQIDKEGTIRWPEEDDLKLPDDDS